MGYGLSFSFCGVDELSGDGAFLLVDVGVMGSDGHLHLVFFLLQDSL